MSERWITFDQAAELVRKRLNCSVGRAEALVRSARASGEIRSESGPVLLLADDGVANMSVRPGAQPIHGITADGKPSANRFPSQTIEMSEDDLLDWLDQHHPSRSPAQPKQRSQARRARAAAAVGTLWPDSVPDQAVLSNARLCKKVGDWLKADCQTRGLTPDVPSDDTILRAAGRK